MIDEYELNPENYIQNSNSNKNKLKGLINVNYNFEQQKSLPKKKWDQTVLFVFEINYVKANR